MASFSGVDPIATLRALAALRPFSERPPVDLTVGFEPRTATGDWLERWASGASNLFAAWDDPPNTFVTLELGGMVKVGIANFPRDVQPILDILASTPFAVAAFGSACKEWYATEHRYIGPGFGDGQYPHGWGGAFKGVGHDRLVSRCWLEYGPWRLVRGADDVSLVQFHDLAVDWRAALEQARPAHQRMGISDTGGFVPTAFVDEHQLKGLYSADERTLRVVVHGRDVSQREMLGACAVRLWRSEPDSPIETIAFMFVEEQQARAHLHELWLRDLQCWVIREDGDVRIDRDYRPRPTPPEWVRDLGC